MGWLISPIMMFLEFDARRHGRIWGVLNLIGGAGFVVGWCVLAMKTGNSFAYLLALMGAVFGTLGSVLSFRYAKSSQESYRLTFSAAGVGISASQQSRQIDRASILMFRLTTCMPKSTIRYEGPVEYAGELLLADGSTVRLPIHSTDGSRHRSAERYCRAIGIPVELVTIGA